MNVNREAVVFFSRDGPQSADVSPNKGLNQDEHPGNAQKVLAFEASHPVNVQKVLAFATSHPVNVQKVGIRKPVQRF